METSTDTRASSRQAAQYLKQFYEEERTKQDRPSPAAPSRSLAPLLALIAIPLCLGLTAWNLVGAQAAGPTFTAAQSEDAARFALYVVSRQVEHFRTEQGRLPESLAEVDPNEDQVRYESTPGGYLLTVETENSVLVYREGDDIGPFAEAAKGRLGGMTQ